MMQAAILVGVLAAVIVLVRHLSRDQVIDRRVRRARRLAIAQLSDRTVAAVSGTVGAAGPELTAPFSRTPCIYYQVEIQAFDPASVTWVTVHAESQGLPFLLRDHTATALVAAGGWQISVDRDARFLPASWQRSAAMRRLLDRRGLEWLRRRRLRYRERLLRDGQAVAALGQGMREPDPAAAPVDYRTPALRLTLRAGRRAPIYITDRLGRSRAQRPGDRRRRS
jgi:hypothetical protein